MFVCLLFNYTHFVLLYYKNVLLKGGEKLGWEHDDPVVKHKLKYKNKISEKTAKTYLNSFRKKKELFSFPAKYLN